MKKEPEVIFECRGWVHQVEGNVAKIALRVRENVVYRWAKSSHLEGSGVCYDMAQFKYIVVRDGSKTSSRIEPYEPDPNRPRDELDLSVLEPFQYKTDNEG